jgi:diguanylate cyclase (GGDEF)-like protein
VRYNKYWQGKPVQLSFYPSRFTNMEIQRLFKLVKSLTGQTNIRDLIASIQTLLSENFKRVSFTVYEIQPARVENDKSPCLACIDCESKEESFLLHDNNILTSVYKDLQSTFYTNDKGSNQAVFPVVLYDNSVSHLISATHDYSDNTTTELLVGLLDIFSDIFRSIHEKGYDPLTRILNRQAFDQIASEIAYSKKDDHSNSENHFNTIAILDIDNFKEINDSFGHSIGDETLVLFAQVVRSVLRQEDLFFRYGGEEFVVLIKGVGSEQAQQVLDRCRQAIQDRRFPQVGSVTVSIGFAHLDDNFHPVTNLTKADKALYFIKKNGRNNVLSYEDLLSQGLLEPVTLQEGEFDFWD